MRRLLGLGLPASRRPFVLDAVRGAVRVEGPDSMPVDGSADRVAVIAHWADSSRLSRSVDELTREFVHNGYRVVLVSTAEDPEPLEWVGPRPEDVTILRRPNVGYDFGSWATAIDRYPAIASAEKVVLINDSLAGPFGSMDGLLQDFEASAADVWGATDTSQFGHHLQSYFLGFRRKSLRERQLQRFWHEIRIERSKDDVIWRNEIGLSALLHRERFVVEAAIPYRRVVREGQNPTIIGWRRLLDRGFPFVKRELVRRPEAAPDGALLRPELRRRFGVEVDEWI
jgi:hypothetical protein